jgi:hypothetical protein
MTLKEKLRQNLTGHLSNYKTEVDVNIAAKIADDYTLEFVKWYDKSNYGIEVYKTLKTYEQVLEIFKKEKGLI